MDKLQKIAEQLLCDLEVTKEKEMKLDAIKDALLEYAELGLPIRRATEEDVERVEKQITDISWNRDQFEMFWEKYGKKVGRTPALKKWLKLKRAEVEKVLATVEDFVKAHPEVQYRPHPVTYINQKRWEDELPTTKKLQRSPSKLNTWQIV